MFRDFWRYLFYIQNIKHTVTVKWQPVAKKIQNDAKFNNSFKLAGGDTII